MNSSSFNTPQTPTAPSATLTGKFHRDLGLPVSDSLDEFLGDRIPRYTNHALRACLNDRNGKIVPPALLQIDESNVIEATFENGRCQKVLVRVPYSNRHDLVLSLGQPNNHFATVVTVWLNDRNDTHKTLRRDQYCQL